MLIFTIFDYIMLATLQFKREEQECQKYADCKRPTSSYESPSDAHRLSFLGKNRKRRTIIIHCCYQS